MNTQNAVRQEYSWERATVDSLLSTTLEHTDLIRPRTHSQVRRRGIQRFLSIIVDGSKSMSARDLAPSRMEMVINSLGTFIPNFFEQNPISQIQLISAKDGVATAVTPLSGNPQQHLARLPNCVSISGDFSIKNALSLAISSLRTIPKYGTREILVIMGSLTSCDPGPISSTIKTLQSHNIVCSIIGLAAEVYLCKQISSKTKGEYRVIKNEQHFTSLLEGHIQPPKILQEAEEKTPTTFIEMGFPTKFLALSPEQEATMNFIPCPCHKKPQQPPFCFCPRCKVKQCSLPTTCTVCGLTLVSSSDLSQSYHHLFPVPIFDILEVMDVEDEEDAILTLLEETRKTAPSNTKCHSCASTPKDYVAACPSCAKFFCLPCDNFIHDVLHNCPGCL
eukprot:TRINITY_DN4215_c0_g2_i1.p2 TRINITY_DN4215_c0_g2~~TRINITY_DN4215_c0_g2_i1.p2  ORF type:complete len:391 (-),score=41.86 TRINITY_DN4215_c0_g2_i1:179-1351(-)